MRRKSEFSSLSLICVVVLLAAATSSAQTAPSQSADPSSANSHPIGRGDHCAEPAGNGLLQGATAREQAGGAEPISCAMEATIGHLCASFQEEGLASLRRDLAEPGRTLPPTRWGLPATRSC